MKLFFFALSLFAHIAFGICLSSSPILLWAQSPASTAVHSTQVSYKVVSDSNGFISEIILKTRRAHSYQSSVVHAEEIQLLTGQNPNVVVMYIGNELSGSNIRKGARTSTLDNLETILSYSGSSLYLPYSSTKEFSYATVQAQLQTAGVSFESVGCVSGITDIASNIDEVLKKQEAFEVKVLVVCAEPEAYEQFDTLGKEINAVKEVQKTLSSKGLSSLFIYTSSKRETNPIEISHARSLLQYTGFGEYTSCDAVCQTQVRWLEGIVAAIILSLASLAGLCCLYMLDTPTRFEIPKENQ